MSGDAPGRHAATDTLLLARTAAAPEDGRLAFWRYLALVHGGYPRRLARLLALEGVDVNRAVSLLAAGCPPPLAARILL